MDDFNARLLALSIERFKSFKDKTRIDLAPLTIIIGRNNSGKSTLIQSVLLLKQTLADPRSSVKLRLDGLVEAFGLRELTFGRPSSGPSVKGPVIELEWATEVDIRAALVSALNPDLDNLARHSGVSWLRQPPATKDLRTLLRIETVESDGTADIDSIEVRSISDSDSASVRISHRNEGYGCSWCGTMASEVEVELDHFIPYLRIDRTAVGPRSRERAWHNAYTILFAQPLEALKKLLSEVHYLGSLRQATPSLFKVATSDPTDIGASGELAAQLLHRRQGDTVHFLPLIDVDQHNVSIPPDVVALPLVSAVDRALESLSVKAPVLVEDIKDIGFRLMLGGANLVHVGRGLTYLLPLVELGLFADPLRFSGAPGSMPLETYRAQCKSFAHIALEEPEAHLHPKVASRLAHWLVSLALANRRLIVETHSDHLVRRLRGLVARAGKDSALERWLLENVAVLSVEQGPDGCSKVIPGRLTAEGQVAERWPADFMDESTDEESAIYYAKLSKTAESVAVPPSIELVDGKEPDSDEAP